MTMSGALAVAVVVVVLVLAVVVAVIVSDLVMVLVATEMVFPATMATPAGVLPASGGRDVVAEARIVVVINVPMEAYGAAKPGARAEEDSADKPLRAIVAKGRALV